MTNRLELNWKLDGFVDEQRYYCSETSIDPENLPVPKAVLGSAARAYIDTNIIADHKYYVRMSAVKGGIEKISTEAVLYANHEPPVDKVVTLLNFEDGLIDLTGKRVWSNDSTSQVTIATDKSRFGTKSLKISRTSTGAIGIRTVNSDDFWFEDQDFGIEASINLTTIGSYHAILSQRISTTSEQSFCFYYYQGTLCFEYSSNGTSFNRLIGSINLSTNTWYDVQVVREGNILKIAVGGSILASVDISGFTFAKSSQPIVVGHLNTSSNGGWWNGHLDEIRVTKGFAPEIKVKTKAFVL